MALILVSEYLGDQKQVARVFYREQLRDWITVFYDPQGLERSMTPFHSEQAAEDHAEDLVS